MILKKLKIVDGIKFKRLNYSGFLICSKCCKYCDSDYNKNKYDERVRSACNKIYIYCNNIQNYCYIFVSKKR